MSWNRSVSPSPDVGDGKVGKRIRRLVISLVLVLLAAGGFILYRAMSVHHTIIVPLQFDPQGISKIRGATNAVMVKGVAPEVKERDSDGGGDAVSTNGEASAKKRMGLYKEWVMPTLTGPKMRYEVFDTHAENELAYLACMPVGTMVLGDFDYNNEDFMKELQSALISEIKINPDDDDDVKYYKQSVIDLKKELKRMLRNGEDIGEALNRSRRELQELGVYKDELEREINKIQNENEDLTDNEVEDFVNAANVMLESKGIEKFEFNKLTREIIKRKPFPDPNDLETEEADGGEGNEDEQKE